MKIRAYGMDGTNMSLVNYMPISREGVKATRKIITELIETIADASEFDVEEICKSLNNHPWTTDSFKPYRPLDDGVSIMVIDCFGNKTFIDVTE